MKTTQILYLILFLGIIVCIITSKVKEGFEDADPKIPSGVEPTRLPIQAQPNSSIPGTLPFGPYGQMASVGSYQYQDPSLLPATLQQIKQLLEDLRVFFIFEGVSVSASGDPSVQLPLSQLRADSNRLEQEVSVLKNNPGIQSSLTQQDIADIQGALTFLQRKIRLFQTAGVISEGFQNPGSDSSGVPGKTRATKEDLQNLQNRIYAAILILTSSGTTDLVVQSRINHLQDMYSAVSDMINKLDKGIWTPMDVPVYEEDISTILPNLANPAADIMDIFSHPSDSTLNSIEKELATLLGEEYAKDIFNNIDDKWMFRVNLELGYNTGGNRSIPDHHFNYNSDSKNDTNLSRNVSSEPLITSSPFDPVVSGAEENNSKVGGLDWKNRAQSICEQIRLRGLDPQDFGCIASGSKMSPAYSWRGHTKMICGRLGTTMDPNLPVVCGCPPQGWKGWGAFY